MAKAKASRETDTVASRTRSKAQASIGPNTDKSRPKASPSNIPRAAGTKRKSLPRKAEEDVVEEKPAKRHKTTKEAISDPKTKTADRKTDRKPEANRLDGEGSNALSSKQILPDKDVHMKVADEAEVDGVLERGHIYFLYRPKVSIKSRDTVSSLDDIAKFDFLLLPRTVPGSKKRRFRAFVIGKKRLPDRSKGGREVFWATMQKFGDDFDKQFNPQEAFGERNYSTKTRGERHIEPSRIAGRGHYAVYSPHPDTPSKRASHLVYFLTHPAHSQLGELHEELGIHETGAFLLQIKNPTGSNPPQAGLRSEKKAKFEKAIIENKFGGHADKGAGKRFIAPNPMSMLDYEGAEVLMIPEKHDAGEVLEDTALEKDLRKHSAKDEKKMSSESVLDELKMDEETFPCDALEGKFL